MTFHRCLKAVCTPQADTELGTSWRRLGTEGLLVWGSTWALAVGKWDWRCVWGFPSRQGCCYSVARLCPTLFDPMNCSTLGFPVLSYLLEFAQIHVHWVSDATQLSHPLSSASSLALNLFQHQRLFQWVSSVHQVAKVLELQFFNVSTSNKYSGLISFRIDQFNLLAVQSLL